MIAEITRELIFAVVWTVLILRTPFMIHHKQRRPLWLVLVVIASGSITIQSWFGTAVNQATRIVQFNNILQGVLAVVDIAVTLEFVVHLTSGSARSRAGQVARAVWPLATVAGMVLSFALTPAAERFKPLAVPGPFLAYVLLAGTYLIAGAGAATWVMWRHLPAVNGRTLYAGLLMVMIGNAAEVPFMTIRTLQRWSEFATPELAQVALIFSTTRFIVMPLGCIVTAIEPARKTILYCYCRARLYSLWRELRNATSGITFDPLVSRRQDLLNIDDAWERLHRRLIEIHDSIFYLHDTWACTELLEHAAREAEMTNRASKGRLAVIALWAEASRPQERRIVAMACWIEVTRRVALSGAPRLHNELDHELLPEQAVQPTMHAEVRYLVRLRRVMRSRRVQAFAKEVVQGQQEPLSS